MTATHVELDHTKEFHLGDMVGLMACVTITIICGERKS